jgi:hypothetical protein
LNSILSFGLFVDFFFFFNNGKNNKQKNKVLLKQIFEQQIGDETPAK